MTSRDRQLIQNIQEIAEGKPLTLLPLDPSLAATAYRSAFSFGADDRPLLLDIVTPQPALTIELLDEEGDFKSIDRIVYEVVAVYVQRIPTRKAAAKALGWNRGTLRNYLYRRTVENANA